MYIPNKALSQFLLYLRIISLDEQATSSLKLLDKEVRSKSMSSLIKQSIGTILSIWAFLNISYDIGFGKAYHSFTSYDHSSWLLQGDDVMLNVLILFSCLLAQMIKQAVILPHISHLNYERGKLLTALVCAFVILLLLLAYRYLSVGVSEYSGYIPNSAVFGYTMITLAGAAFPGFEPGIFNKR